MALRLRKDIKKASYYVWFLGAQESRGLRGDEFAIPAVRYLEQRANDLEPFKVTLQVSHKGLKIIQNVQNKGKQQTIKHFIPHSSITSAVVQGDIVACVLLLYNPITGCPVHVHAYRCDSEHTSEILYSHLQALIDRPENQKKFAEIERKLQLRGALTSAKKPPDSSLGSEVSTRESDSASNEERSVANLYDSLAAELKQKLSTGKKGVAAKSPILLPPRDYDTVHRQKGNLSNIDTRRCLNQNIVGVNARRKLESSGGSSGIGSDLAPSPERNDYARQHDNHSTSEEDWAESTAYMMHEAFDTAPRRAISPQRHSSPPQRHASPPRRAISPLQRQSSPPHRHSSPPRRAISPPHRHSSPPRRAISPPHRHSSPPPRRAISPQRHFSPHRHSSPPQRAMNARRYDQGYDETVHSYRDQLAPFREHAFERRFRHESLENVTKHDYDDQYRRRYGADTKRRDERDDKPRGKLQRGVSESSLKVADVSPKDRFNVAKEKFMNLERERFNRELEQQMAIRRSIIERNCRSPSPDNDRMADRREERLERQERAHREIERLPRVGRKRDEVKRYEYGSEEFLDREKPTREEYRYKERRELERRIEEDDVIEPVIEDRRREWSDRQRAFSRSRLLQDQRQYPQGKSYYDRDYRDFSDLSERNQAKFRHSYAEPIPRGRLGTVRPY